jgi:uncharacterized coiled-coil protein SlyX
MNEFSNEQILAANNNTQSDMIKELSTTIGQLHTQIAHDNSVIKSLSAYVQKLEQENAELKKDLNHLTPKQEADTVEQSTSDPKTEKEEQMVSKKQTENKQGGDK